VPGTKPCIQCVLALWASGPFAAVPSGLSHMARQPMASLEVKNLAVPPAGPPYPISLDERGGGEAVPPVGSILSGDRTGGGSTRSSFLTRSAPMVHRVGSTRDSDNHGEPLHHDDRPRRSLGRDSSKEIFLINRHERLSPHQLPGVWLNGAPSLLCRQPYLATVGFDTWGLAL
jgi:hypothetical protein